jgi:hypothetical protein
MIDLKKIDEMKNNEGFLNDMWNSYTLMGKFDLLVQGMGLDVLDKSYEEWCNEFIAKEADANHENDRDNFDDEPGI